MSSKSKRGGRVTPKGTKVPKKSKAARPDQATKADPVAGHLPQQVRKEHGRGSRPITHNRGNR